MLNLDLVFKKLFILALVFIFTGIILLEPARASENLSDRNMSLAEVKNWHQFQLRMQAQDHHEKSKGLAYMISGGLLVVGGIVGYHNAHNSVEKLAYSVSQSLGVAGIGYGAYLSYVGGEQKSFFQSIAQSKSLNEGQRDELVQNYVNTWEESQKNERVTRIATHSLIGALNIYNGLREEQSDLRQGLIILGGVNLLAAVSLSFEF